MMMEALWLTYVSLLTHGAETNIDGKQIAKQGGSEWSFTYPTGLRNVLKYMKKNYDNPRILITENGINIFWMSILHVFAVSV